MAIPRVHVGAGCHVVLRVLAEEAQMTPRQKFVEAMKWLSGQSKVQDEYTRAACEAFADYGCWHTRPCVHGCVTAILKEVFDE